MLTTPTCPDSFQLNTMPSVCQSEYDVQSVRNTTCTSSLPVSSAVTQGMHQHSSNSSRLGCNHHSGRCLKLLLLLCCIAAVIIQLQQKMNERHKGACPAKGVKTLIKTVAAAVDWLEYDAVEQLAQIGMMACLDVSHYSHNGAACLKQPSWPVFHNRCPSKCQLAW